MSNLDRFCALPSEHPLKADPIEPSEGVLRFPSTPASAATRSCGDALDLVYQVAEVIKGVENQATEAERRARDIAENALQKLQVAENRIQELETELDTAKACINEARVKIKEADEAAKVDGARLEAADLPPALCARHRGVRDTAARLAR
jgi:predicted S18 family serine protease